MKVMGFQSFGDRWKKIIQIMDEQLATSMKVKNEKNKIGWMEYSNHGWKNVKMFLKKNLW